jgi:hypothetical protein
MDFASLGKFSQLTPDVKQHLSRVYATLSGGLMAVALGVYLDEKFRVAGLMTQLLFIAMAVGLNFVAGKTTSCMPALFIFHQKSMLFFSHSSHRLVFFWLDTGLVFFSARCVQQAHHLPRGWPPHGLQFGPTRELDAPLLSRHCYHGDHGDLRDFCVLLCGGIDGQAPRVL